jgi:hypothetical protein
MECYHFNVLDRGEAIEDSDGMELPSMEAARRTAAQLASDILADSAKQAWHGADWQVQVTNGAGLILFTLLITGIDAPALGEGRQLG